MVVSKTAPPKASIPPMAMVIGLVLVLGLGGFFYLDRASKKPPPEPPPLTGEARAYASKLKLTNVEMKAHESYLKQSVVEIVGNIQNVGDRVVKTVEITVRLLRRVRPGGVARASPHRESEDRRGGAGADQAVPPALRQRSGKLESGDAATGDGGDRVSVGTKQAATRRRMSCVACVRRYRSRASSPQANAARSWRSFNGSTRKGGVTRNRKAHGGA